MKKTVVFISALILTVLIGLPLVRAQVSNDMVCTPISQNSDDNFVDDIRTRLECRLSSNAPEYLLVGKFTFPFNIIELAKVTSSYASAIGIIMDAQPGSSTVAFTTMTLGDATTPPRFQPAPLDQLSFVVETDELLSIISDNIEAGATQLLTMLSPGPGSSTVYTEHPVNLSIQMDSSLILEAAGYSDDIGVLELLNIAKACFQQSAFQCVSNLINNL